MPATPAPDDQVWFQGLRWAEAVDMQAARVEEAVREQHEANTDATIRASLNSPEGDTELGAQRRAAFEAEPEISSRPVRVPSWSLGMQVSTEMDFLMVAVRNLLRAQDRLPAGAVTAMVDQAVLKILRDAAEHYDEEGGRAERYLAEKYPRVLTDAFHFTSKEIWIGGGPSGVPLSRIRAWSARVTVALRQALEDAGVSVPNDFDASLMEGDDRRPWPADRFRFGWWLPVVPELEWPMASRQWGLSNSLPTASRTSDRDGNDQG